MPHPEFKRYLKTYRSFPLEAFEEYFGEIGEKQGKDTFAGQGWRVRILHCGVVWVGKISFPEVTLELYVAPEVAPGFFQELRMAFLRGGG